MEEMMRMYSGGNDMPKMPVDATLVVNTASPLIAGLADKAKADPDTAKVLAKHIYSLCLISQRKLTAEELTEFLSDSYDILGRL